MVRDEAEEITLIQMTKTLKRNITLPELEIMYQTCNDSESSDEEIDFAIESNEDEMDCPGGNLTHLTVITGEVEPLNGEPEGRIETGTHRD